MRPLRQQLFSHSSGFNTNYSVFGVTIELVYNAFLANILVKDSIGFATQHYSHDQPSWNFCEEERHSDLDLPKNQISCGPRLRSWVC